MRITFTTLLVSSLVLSACGLRDSRVNPANWFGDGQPEAVAVEAPENVNPLIPTRSGLLAKRKEEVAIYQGSPIQSVSALVIERRPGGAVIRATGVARIQGAYAARLTPVTEEEVPVDGVLTYRLEVIRDENAQVQGSEASREVTVARSLTRQQLANVNTIRVESATNALVSRR